MHREDYNPTPATFFNKNIKQNCILFNWGYFVLSFC